MSDRRAITLAVNGEKHGIGILGSFSGCTGTCFAPRLACQLLELVVIPSVTEDNFMSRSRKDRSQLCAHQPRTQDADAHVLHLTRYCY